MSEHAEDKNITKTVIKSVVAAVAMFAFVFVVLVPLYDVICEITGLNGKGGNTATAEVASKVDESRTVRVTFVTANNELMPWEFRANEPVLEVHPGQTVNTSFFVKNVTAKDMVSRAIPSFVPSNSGNYFHKMECFCFNNQPLGAGESTDMGLQFYVDPELPKNITNITLSYTLFDITDMAEDGAAEENKVSSVN